MTEYLELPWWIQRPGIWYDRLSNDWYQFEGSNVNRPTEDEALRRIAKQMRTIGKHTKAFELSWLHRWVMTLERECMAEKPHFSEQFVIGYVSERTSIGVGQVKALLDEASAILTLRDALGLSLEVVGVEVRRAA